jgi:hypothetical protein
MKTVRVELEWILPAAAAPTADDGGGGGGSVWRLVRPKRS